MSQGEPTGEVPVQGVLEQRIPIPIAESSDQPTNRFARVYDLMSNEVGIHEIKGGEWIKVDGVEYMQGGTEQHEYPTSEDETVVRNRVRQVGTFNSSGGTLAYVDGHGVMHIGHSTEENLQALKDAGYREEALLVPFSNGEVPTDLNLRRKYLEMRQHGAEQNRQRNHREHLKTFEAAANNKKIRPVEGGLFIMVDGVEYQQWGHDVEQIPINTDGNKMAINRVSEVGTYDTNNNTIAYVDEQGRMWVGASTDENYAALKQAGYRSENITVPFSNRERPTDKETYEQIRDVLTGKPADKLRAERTARVEEMIRERTELFGAATVVPDRHALFVRVADGTEREYVNIEELVQERLQPRNETDQAGYNRKIYTLNGATFAFKGREEIPIYPTVLGSNSQLLGGPANFVGADEFAQYKEQISRFSAQSETARHFVTNKTIVGVIELAMSLGSQDTELPQLRDEIAKGVYSSRTLRLIDALVAANFGDFSGFNAKPGSHAEAIVVLALLGDAQAQSAVERFLDMVRREKNTSASKNERRDTEIKPLRPQDLCVVHATRYLPKSTSDGDFAVPTTFDATNGTVLRNTIHTSLNHKVGSHMNGSWEDTGYVVVAPFEDMMRANGVPTVLNTVDTYWAMNPGESLRFANGTLISPGGKDIEGLFVEDGNTTKFKSDGYNSDTLATLADYARNNRYYDSFAKRINKAMDGLFRGFDAEIQLGNQWDLNKTHAALNKYLNRDDSDWEYNSALLDLLTSRSEGQTDSDLEVKLRQIFLESNADLGLKPEVQDREAAVNALVDSLVQEIKSSMFAEINELTVREVIHKRGFTIHTSGGWAWGDSSKVTDQTRALGADIGVPVEAHVNTPDRKITDISRTAKNKATENQDGKPKFNWTMYDVSFDDVIGSLNQQTRRVVYASGLLNSRD